SAAAWLFFSNIFISASLSLLFFASRSIVPTKPFTIPRKKRSAFTSYRQRAFSKTQREYSILQLKVFTCVFFFEKEVKLLNCLIVSAILFSNSTFTAKG